MKSSAEVTHCAPELIKAHINIGTVDAPLPTSVQGDVYALGCVIYQLIHRLSLRDVIDESGMAVYFREEP